MIFHYIVLSLLLLIVLLLWAGFQAQKKNAEQEWVYRQQLGKTLTAAARVRRNNHLETMKALKGDSYAGKFGEFDIHTDSQGGFGIIKTDKGPW